MAISVVGQASAAATSVAIPTHAVGDLLLVSARGTAAAPSVPTAGGTVPAWTTLQTGLANAIGLTVVSFVATATTTTTGAFTNATHICVLVLRPTAGNTIQTSAAQSAVGSANNQTTIGYPALTLVTADGTSMGVRVGTRVTAAAQLATGPSGWTTQTQQPSGTPAIVVLNRAALVANPVLDTTTAGGANAAWRAITIEVRDITLVQSVAVGNVGSGQSFGSVVMRLPPQFVSVQGIPRGLVTASIVGGFIAGDGHLVGQVASGDVLFGTPAVKIIQNVPVAGVASAQGFGAVTTAKGSVARAVTGVGTAQAFGSIAFRVTLGSGGVLTAQAFGIVTPKATRTLSVSSVSSAQAFGVVTPKPKITLVITGRGSAQAFGSVLILTAGKTPVFGVQSAQGFGVPIVVSLAFGQTVSVQGVLPSGAAPTFNPGGITGLGMWLDASKLALADGADVYLWPDLSGLGNDMSSRVGIDNPANLKTNAYRGLSTMRFTSANGEFFWHGGTPIGTVGEVFVVTKYFGATFPEYTGFFGDATALLLLGTMGANILYPANVGSPTYYYNGVDSTATRKAPMNELAVLGLSFTPITLTPIIGVDRFTSTRYLDGDVSEIIVYDHVLTTAERAQVNDYLLAKWLGIGGAPASQFGTVTATVAASFPQTKTVTGLGTAQAFGAATIKTAFVSSVSSVSSAQSFGTLTFRLSKLALGVPSAQAFGAPTVAIKPPMQIVQVQGIGDTTIVVSIVGQFLVGQRLVGWTGGKFGHPAVFTAQVVPAVPGVPSAQQFGAVRTRNLFTVPGVGSAQRFGAVTAINYVTVQGVPSAQLFGAPHIMYPQWIPVGGVTSTAAVGKPRVLRSLTPVSCSGLGSVVVTCTPLTSVVSACQNLTGTAPSEPGLTLTPAETRDLTLTEA